MINRITSHGTDFSPYRDQVSITESRMTTSIENGVTNVYLVGILTNRSEFAWKNIRVDARFYDKAGVMIDAVPHA